jgi:transposase
MTKDEELEWLRKENAALREEVGQIATLREELAKVKEHLQALQDQQAKDSRNSSKPPSSDGFKRRTKSLRKKSGKKPGAQKGHPGHHLQRVKEPDAVIIHEVSSCGHCGKPLDEQGATHPESRQVFDVPPQRLWVVEHQAEEKRCPQCDKLTRAAFPPAVCAPAQYGPGLAGLAVYLVEGQFVPYARAGQLLQEWFGVQMSAGSLASFVKQCHAKLAGVEEQIKEALQKGAVLHQDETGLRVKRKTHWVHVACTARLTHYAAHANRGRKAMEALGISPAFHGVSMHDGLTSYRAFACEHALCNAHHLRELTFVEEELKQEWAGKMKELLLCMKARVEQAKAAGLSGLDALSVLALSADYDHLLEQGWKANPPPQPPPDPPAGADGKPAAKRSRKQPPARKLLQRLQVGKRQALAFLYDFAVPFDNDVIAYCTPSAWLACFVRRVWSLFVGWRKQRNPTAIDVIHGNATSLPPIPDRLWADSIGLCGFTGG